MTGLSSPGIGSGLDINGIVNKLMTVESRPLTVLAQREASFQARLTAFGSLKGALAGLQTAARTLATQSTFTAMTATVSDPAAVSAAATSAAAAGSYNIGVTTLAKFHSVRSNINVATTSATFTTGALAVRVGSGAAVNIAIDGTNNTLAGIRDAINAAGAGVNASIVFDGTAQRLVLTSKTLGSAGAISVTATDSGSGGTHALGGLASANLITARAADDAQFSVNGVAITRSANSVGDVIEGVTFNLTKEAANATVTVAKNTGAVTSALNVFVKAYNDATTAIRNMTAYDAANRKAAVLTGDGTARSIQGQLSGLVQASVAGVSGGISRLSDIGIAVQKDGALATDSGRLAAALADPGKDLAALFAQTASGNQGIAVRFDTILEGIVGPSGLIGGRTDGLNASIKDLHRRADALNLRLEQIERRYRAQFAALDTLVASMTQTSNFLSQQLANLPKISSAT
ncbi:MAG: flagellar filament capping protein FliD [Sulfuritalea sp.]|nr:flagellar filament capping protein FliD [Sulfuritalea sp.]